LDCSKGMSSGGSEGQSSGPAFGWYCTTLSSAKIVLDKTIVNKQANGMKPSFKALGADVCILCSSEIFR